MKKTKNHKHAREEKRGEGTSEREKGRGDPAHHHTCT